MKALKGVIIAIALVVFVAIASAASLFGGNDDDNWPDGAPA